MGLALVMVKVIAVQRETRKKGRIALALASAAVLTIVNFSTGRVFNGWLSDRLIFLAVFVKRMQR